MTNLVLEIPHIFSEIKNESEDVQQWPTSTPLHCDLSSRKDSHVIFVDFVSESDLWINSLEHNLYTKYERS